MKEKFALAVSLLSLFFASCRATDPDIILLPPPSTVGVYVVNEGGFSGGGALSYYDKTLDSVFNNVVGTSEGWVFPNDMKIIQNKGYVAVNGLNRVDVINTITHQYMHSITYPASNGPGYIAAGMFNGSVGFLYTANYDGSVSIIDGSVDTLVTTKSNIVGFPGGIAYAGGKIFVSDFGPFSSVGTIVKVMRGSDAEVMDSVTVNNAPGALTVLNGKVFVLCTGTSKIYQLNAETSLLEDSLQLSGYYSDMTTDGTALYAMSSDSVTKITIVPLQVTQNAIVKRTDGTYFYTLSVDDLNGDLYVSNVTTGGGSGQLEIYTSSGILKRPPLPVGVFPGAIVLKR